MAGEVLTAHAESSCVHSLMSCLLFVVIFHKQPHIQAGVMVFTLWSILPCYTGRAVAVLLVVLLLHN